MAATATTPPLEETYGAADNTGVTAYAHIYGPTGPVGEAISAVSNIDMVNDEQVRIYTHRCEDDQSHHDKHKYVLPAEPTNSGSAAVSVDLKESWAREDNRLKLLQKTATRAAFKIACSFVHPLMKAQITPPGLGFKGDTTALVAAVKSNAIGAGSDEAGLLDDELAAWTWPVKGRDNALLSPVQQVQQAGRDMLTFHDRSRLINPAGAYKEPQLVRAIVRRLPAPYRHVHTELKAYRAHTTIQALVDELAGAAVDHDDTQRRGVHALAQTAVPSAFASLTPDQLQRLISLATSTTTAGDKLTRTRRFDKDAGPLPEHGLTKYCSHHGWTHSHSSPDCFVLHPEKRPTRQPRY